MRGKHRSGRWRARMVRIIPACAGQTACNPGTHDPRPDHPRLCGANRALMAQHSLQCGSSPLVRGKHPSMPRALSAIRIIPACAGQTTHTLLEPYDLSDHPRLCGANRVCDARGWLVAGSSPLVRGKPSCSTSSKVHCRIIPACAGQTAWNACGSPTVPDHPRLCGANFALPSLSTLHVGSSPLVRGKHC